MTSRPAAPTPHPLAEGIEWDAVRDEAAQTLSAYVKLDSSHPVGRTVETAGLMAEKLAAEGITSKVYETPDPNKVNLVARLSAKDPVGKPLLLSSHMDVVQAVAEDWTFDPYSGEIANGYIYGRGAMDDKGMGIMNLMTLLLLKRNDVELSRDVVVLYTCDEEIGSPLGAQFMVENHFADLDPAFMLDEGGQGAKEFYSAGDAFEIVVGEKKICRITMTARAEPGHGSQPWDEAATHRLTRAVARVLATAPEDRECAPVAEMIRRLGGEKAREEIARHRSKRPLLHDTIALTMMEAGYKINIIPEKASMSFDCRLLPDTDASAFVSNVQQIVNDEGVAFDVEWPDAAPSMAPVENPLFSAIEQACLAYLPAALPVPTICVGGTDARFFRQLGIPSYGLVPAMYTGEDMKGFHGIDERLSVENLLLGTKIVFDLTLRAAAR
ncbi:MAG TPA: M20/M25/M40 family metallo-hydrolase [Chloroflexota bacterium]|nr:M20/M25/M40 family metallo-hydrolase [Chloroflexota bacterium]